MNQTPNSRNNLSVHGSTLGYILVTLTAVVAFYSCHPSFSSLENSPNIILICADDLGWSDLGCYGSEIQTPHLDRLASEGMKFVRFSNTSKCFPSRASLLTGVYAQDCGYARSHLQPIRNAVTLGEVLQKAGYLTFWSGKHHGIENPIDRGFDRYFGLRDGACNYFNPGVQRPGEEKPAQKRPDRAWCIDSITYQPYTPEHTDFYTTDDFTDYALSYITEANRKSRPFFLYLAYNAPHDPLMAWPEDIQRYDGVYDLGYDHIRQTRYQKQLDSRLIDSSFFLSPPQYPSWESMNTELRDFEATKMEVYAAMIDRMDQNIGRLLTHLNELSLEENTVIIFVSDNGASAEVVHLDHDDDSVPVGSMERWVSLGPNWANVSNTPFKMYKNYSFEGGINTPMIARWPGKIKSESISHFPGHFVDFMPTLVELTNGRYPETFREESIVAMRGVSLLPIFRGEEPLRTHPVFWNWRDGKAVRSGSWKLVKQGVNNPWELYDLSNDPTEMVNKRHSHPEMAAKLEDLYRQWEKSYSN